ncbi:MAG: site-specific integrase [Cyclobacteriaceae bacterium]|nr:site-specific integrase [Cyclobacteriaceae bacterium]
MVTVLTMAISYYLKSPSKKESPIYVSFRYDGKRLQTSTGWKIATKKWSKARQLPKPQLESEEYESIMNHLNRVSGLIEFQYKSLKSQGTIPTPNELKKYLEENLFTTEEEEDVDTSFLSVIDSFIESSTSLLAPTTIKKYNTLKSKVESFSNERNLRLQLENIDLTFEAEFKHWMLTSTKRYANSRSEVGMLDDTISKYIGCIKTAMKWSMERGLHSNTAFMKFTARKEAKHEIIVLNENEIKSIIDLELEGWHNKVRDIFLLMFYTTQRWGDIMKFNKSQISDNTWIFKQEKTNKLMKIPLVGFSAEALSILQRYNYTIPQMTIQVFNREIKEICKEAKIKTLVSKERKMGSKKVTEEGEKWEFVSAHTARRSAISFLLLKGMPPNVVMKLTGHTSLKTLMKYEHTSVDDLSKALSNV